MWKPRIQMIKKGFSVLLLVLGLTVFSSASANAATYYLSPSGNDLNAGSDSSPLKTFAAAFKKLVPGDTLLVKDGTYEEKIDRFPTGGTAAKPYVIKAQNARKVLIKPNGTDVALSISSVSSTPKTYITIEGFIFECIRVTSACVQLTANADQTGVDHIRIINNEIMHAAGAAVFAPHGQYEAYGYYGAGIIIARSNYVEVINNDIHDNGKTDFDHGAYCYGDNNLYEGNRVYNNRGTGLKIGWAGSSKNNIIRNNIVYDNNNAWKVNPAYGVKRQGRGIGTYFSSGMKIYNNIIWGDHAAGIDATYGPVNAEIYNNTVYVNGSTSSGSYGIVVGGGKSSEPVDVISPVVRNNIVVQNNTNPPSVYNYAIHIAARTRNAIAENNLTFGRNPELHVDVNAANGGAFNPTVRNNIVNKDPQFVNLTGFDFHLKSTSPAINAGANIASLTFDYSNGLRPQGGGMDIGAYEYGGAPAPTTKPTLTPAPTTMPTVTPTPVATVSPTKTPTPFPATPTPVAATPAKPGDANGDNKVNEADLSVWSANYAKSLRGPQQGDFNNNGIVDGVDYSIWLSNYGL